MKFAQARLMRGVLGLAAGALVGFVVGSPIGVGAHGMLPILSLLTPSLNETVHGQVTFYAGADSAGLASLRFQVDGQDVGSEIVSGMCRTTWDSTKSNDGLHTIQAVGVDQYGNVTLSLPITVLVSNLAIPEPTPTPTPPPGPGPTVVVTITAPVSGASVSGREVAISAKFPPETLFLSYVLQDRETGAARWSVRGPELPQTQTSATFVADLSAMPAGLYDLRVVAQRRFEEVISAKIPVTVAAPTPPATLTMTLATVGGRDYSVTALLKRGDVRVAGATVTFVITTPKGARWTFSAVTNSQGIAQVVGRMAMKDPRGTYRVTASARTSGLSVTVSGSFIY